MYSAWRRVQRYRELTLTALESGSSKELMVAAGEGICEQRLLLMLWVLEKEEGRGEQEQEGM